MAKTWEDLPEECWESIFDRLQTSQDHEIETLSLVCKRFLSLSNRLRSVLNISDRTALLAPEQDISPLFRRFPLIKRISLVGFNGDVHTLIRTISRSDLRLEALDLSNQKLFPFLSIEELGSKMKATMKTLICAKLHILQNCDLQQIAISFPALEELDISYPMVERVDEVRDDGIAALASKLPKLRSIDLSGNNFISDASLIMLSSNCSSLSKISAQNCSFLTDAGINHVIRHCSELRSLSICGDMMPSSPADAIKSFRLCASTLHCLDLHQVSISDDLLFVIGEAGLRLNNLVIAHCEGFTFVGISGLLRRCNSLQYLCLDGTGFLTDVMMSSLSEHLQCLISIRLALCTYLTSSTIFSLAKNCPSLEEIRMLNTSLGKEDPVGKEESVPYLEKKCRLRSLVLPWNKYLRDETLERIGSVCSELRSLTVSHCWSITEVGIGGIGKCCTEITELMINGCGQVRNLGSGLGFSKLEVLMACSSGIGDEGLRMIGQGCGRLRTLHLSGCVGVTQRGLKELVRSDSGRKVMRKLNLKDCCNISADFLAWMVFSSPSMRTLISPSDSLPSMKQRDLFLRHGCLVTSEENFP